MDAATGLAFSIGIPAAVFVAVVSVIVLCVEHPRLYIVEHQTHKFAPIQAVGEAFLDASIRGFAAANNQHQSVG